MWTLFHLVRHGSYSLLDRALGGRVDYPLSSQGRDDAERAARWLTSCPIGELVSSPMRRALETADFISRRTGVPVQTDPAFAEIDFADWTGLRFEDLQDDPAWQAWNRFRGTAGVPGGETMLAVQARAIAGMVRHARHEKAQVVVVSHADVIKAVLVHFMGAPLDLMRRIEIGPGSVSQLLLHAEDAKVLAVNMRP